QTRQAVFDHAKMVTSTAISDKQSQFCDPLSQSLAHASKSANTALVRLAQKDLERLANAFKRENGKDSSVIFDRPLRKANTAAEMRCSLGDAPPANEKEIGHVSSITRTQRQSSVSNLGDQRRDFARQRQQSSARHRSAA